MVRYLFYTIGDLTYKSPLVDRACRERWQTQTAFQSEILNARSDLENLGLDVRITIQFMLVYRNRMWRTEQDKWQGLYVNGNKPSSWDLRCFGMLRTYGGLVSSYQLHAHFLYSITIYMLHYHSQHVSSSTLLIFRRTNCIITASGIVTLCKQPYSMPVESGLQSALNRHTVRLFTESDDTRCCNNIICPPEDEQGTARNVLRIIM